MKKIFLKLNRKAFTLIELLVSLTIFSFVVVMAIGALYSAQNYSAKAQESQVILDGLNFTMEIMSREIRYGTNFYCDPNPSGDIPNSDQIGKNDCFGPELGKVLFLQPNNKTSRVVYYLDGRTIKRKDFANSPATVEDVTSPDINVESFNFYVKGSNGIGLSNYDQPRITVIIAGKTIPNNVNIKPTLFRIQNTITQRVLDTVQ